MPEPISTTLFIDPACPFGYSATPALRVLRWRYGAQLDWRLAMIGLSESTEPMAKRGFTPLRLAKIWASFRRYGMPFAIEPKDRLSISSRGCRAVVAAGLTSPGSEWKALRALQLANFTTGLLLDDDDAISAVTGAATGIPAETIRALLDDPATTEAYERDRADARTAAGTPAELQGTTAISEEGLVRYTAPSVIFERGGTHLVAGGMQTIEAYDVLVANIDPSLERRTAPEDAAALFAAVPEGLTTGEVAALVTRHNQLPDVGEAEQQLIGLVDAGELVRIGIGDSALWTTPAYADEWHAVFEAASLQPVGG
jgi:protein-disulfide isomerase-like protein with CxxC motif